jgi:hypothetical protein
MKEGDLKESDATYRSLIFGKEIFFQRTFKRIDILIETQIWSQRVPLSVVRDFKTIWVRQSLQKEPGVSFCAPLFW